jgi:hypothetical protein
MKPLPFWKETCSRHQPMYVSYLYSLLACDALVVVRAIATVTMHARLVTPRPNTLSGTIVFAVSA